jgi:hypothetical protein
MEVHLGCGAAEVAEVAEVAETSQKPIAPVERGPMSPGDRIRKSPADRERISPADLELLRRFNPNSTRNPLCVRLLYEGEGCDEDPVQNGETNATISDVFDLHSHLKKHNPVQVSVKLSIQEAYQCAGFEKRSKKVPTQSDHSEMSRLNRVAGRHTVVDPTPLASPDYVNRLGLYALVAFLATLVRSVYW